MSQNVHSCIINFSEFEKTRKILNITHQYNYTQKNNKLLLIQDASKFQSKNVLWTLINPPVKNFHGFKAKDKDIAKICHTMIDFDSPTQPQAALDFATQLLQHPFIKKYLPENSSILATGGGARILVSIDPLENTPSNLEAFKITMKQFIRKIDNIRKEMNFDTVSVDSTFDVSRVYALAGTYRPYKPHKNDHSSLKNGFILYWYTPLTIQYATALREKIVAVSNTVKQQKVQNKKKKKQERYQSFQERNFIETMIYEIEEEKVKKLAINLAKKYYGKNYTKEVVKDRSVAFARILNAIALMKDETYAIEYSHIVDYVTGEKYGCRVKSNAKNLMKTFVRKGKKQTRRVMCHLFQKEMLYKWFHNQTREEKDSFVSLALLYEIYSKTVKKPVSRKEFTQLLKKQGYIEKQKRIDGIMTRGLIDISLVPFKYHTFSKKDIVQCFCIYTQIIHATTVLKQIFIDLCSLPSG